MPATTLLALLLIFSPAQEGKSPFTRIEFPSSDGLTITADVYAPHADPETPFLLLCHQARWSRGEYREIAPRFNAMGFNCMAIDQRSGEGTNNIENETAKAARARGLGTGYLDARPDIGAALRYARKTYARGPLIAVGSSYSASLVLEIVGNEKGIADGVISFAPGEYFARFGASATFVTDGARKLEVPVFITSARKEESSWRPIYDEIPSHEKAFYLPGTKGNHGARALWKRFDDSPGYWNALSVFLDERFPREQARAGSEPSGSRLASDGRPDPDHPSLHAWYDAARGVVVEAGLVSAWKDRSTNRRHLARVSEKRDERPRWVELDPALRRPAVVFDGNDCLWAAPEDAFGTLDGPKTILVDGILQLADGGYFFDGTHADARNAFFSGQQSHPGQWVTFTGTEPVTGGGFAVEERSLLHTLVYGDEAVRHYVNGVLVGEGRSTLQPLGGLMVGARFNRANRLRGAIHELLIYEGALPDSRRRELEKALLRGRESLPPEDPIETPPYVDVFESGDGLYHTYRIPAVLTTRAGTVLALAEGRASRSDHARNDIVMRRSRDGGDTWSPVSVLADDGGHSLNNPCVVQVDEGPRSGRILLMYQRYPEGCHEGCVVPGNDGPKICRSFLLVSDDDGRSFGEPLELTSQVKPPGATSIAGGPGIGLQKRRDPHRGRIVFPFNRGPRPDWKVFAVFSDDGGDSWRFGRAAPDASTPGTGNEVQMVELSDGRLLLNTRSYAGSRLRKQATSADGGETWSELCDVADLIEPQVMASVLAVEHEGRERLYYAGPYSRTWRIHGRVLTSEDGGRSWKKGPFLYRGSYAYGVLTRVDDARMGCLFERDDYRFISLVRF